MNESKARAEWVERQQEHGSSPRAVLMKGLHPLLNQSIDAWQRTVMRHALSKIPPENSNLPTLDMGCGYGRLAAEAERCGHAPVVGIDFAHRFCVDFKVAGRDALCGELSRLPFLDSTFKSAYSVTALMYLSLPETRAALLELDRCLVDGARILLLEPSFEFNRLIRSFLRTKLHEKLSRPGLTSAELLEEAIPPNWRPISAGGCSIFTTLLPVLMISTRFPKFYRWIAARTVGLSSPGRKLRVTSPMFTMYRWVVFEKSGLQESEPNAESSNKQATK